MSSSDVAAMRQAPTRPPRRGLPVTRRATLLAAGGALLLAGCGFQLRGSASLPFATLYSGFAPASPLGIEFRSAIGHTETTRLVDRPEDAEARLDILEEHREKETVGFSSTGRPREYQLRLIVTFRLVSATGDELIPPSRLALHREITTTDTQYVAKEQEEALLYRDMERDLIQQLMRRLAVARR